jgi:hypothetical protein
MDKVYAHVGEVIKKNARNFVDLASIFTLCSVGIGRRVNKANAA